jgi:hypothetical protein
LPNPGFKSASDLAGLTADKGAGLTMTKIDREISQGQPGGFGLSGAS